MSDCSNSHFEAYENRDTVLQMQTTMLQTNLEACKHLLENGIELLVESKDVMSKSESLTLQLELKISRYLEAVNSVLSVI